MAFCPPPVTTIESFSLYKLPSFVIVVVAGIPVTVAFMNISDSSDSVPLITSLVWKVPDIVSVFKTNSDISFVPIWNLKTFSTTAVAPEVSPSIERPSKLDVSPTVPITLNILLVFHLPVDALNKFSLG